MTKKRKLIVIFVSLCILEIGYFGDNLFPVYWGKVKVTGLSCTCPDETVVNGRLYLRWITPDSLKKYNLDYSEIFVTERPMLPPDHMGADFYIIKGYIIGKERVSKEDPWHPIFKVESWDNLNPIIDYFVKFIFFLQLILMSVFYRRIQ